MRAQKTATAPPLEVYMKREEKIRPIKSATQASYRLGSRLDCSFPALAAPLRAALFVTFVPPILASILILGYVPISSRTSDQRSGVTSSGT